MAAMLRAIVLAVLVALSTGTTLLGRVAVRETQRPPTMKIIVNGGQKTVLTRVDGSFSVEGLEAGTYSLEVGTSGWTFPLYTVTVEENGKIRSSFYTSKKQRTDLSHPLKLEPFARPVYFVPRKQMNIAAMFMNPMGLMMLFMVVTVFILPKMMDGMDPEELKKVQADMRKSQGDQDPQKLLSGFFGGGGGDDSDSD